MANIVTTTIDMIRGGGSVPLTDGRRLHSWSEMSDDGSWVEHWSVCDDDIDNTGERRIDEAEAATLIAAFYR